MPAAPSGREKPHDSSLARARCCEERSPVFFVVRWRRLRCALRRDPARLEWYRCLHGPALNPYPPRRKVQACNRSGPSGKRIRLEAPCQHIIDLAPVGSINEGVHVLCPVATPRVQEAKTVDLSIANEVILVKVVGICCRRRPACGSRSSAWPRN